MVKLVVVSDWWITTPAGRSTPVGLSLRFGEEQITGKEEEERKEENGRVLAWAKLWRVQGAAELGGSLFIAVQGRVAAARHGAARRLSCLGIGACSEAINHGRSAESRAGVGRRQSSKTTGEEGGRVAEE